ncbi:unnamed protein product [Notodromas monacha]|uniref:Uncharacterized protein n=1 Tax=Notodromas monacha TaxID=399045 RepID=A0A7R9C2X4_9CRUS|nr:unnamed protein product [Notodromas monacha]CAG0925328.1 unnamed protein product [Notodromas monacha]
MLQSELMGIWLKGGNLLVHAISPNGTHYEVLLGDEIYDSHATFVAIFEPNTWLAVELEDNGVNGGYGFFYNVLIPAYKHEFMVRGTEEELVGILGKEHAATLKPNSRSNSLLITLSEEPFAFYFSSRGGLE